jgi:hypothetical protein
VHNRECCFSIVLTIGWSKEVDDVDPGRGAGVTK